MPGIRWLTFRSGLPLLAAALLAACARPETPIRVGLTVWPGYEGFHLAASLGYLEGHPIRVVALPAGGETMRALRDGVIDAAGLTGDELLVAAEQSPEHPPRAVLVVDVSNGGDVILAHRPFARMQDLRGKRIGVEATALGGMMLARALEISGMQPGDITAVPIPLFDHERAFRNHEVDAIVTFEPRASHLAATGANRLFDSSRIPGEIVDLLVVRDDVLQRSAPQIRQLVEAWFRAQAHARSFPDEALRQGAQREQLTPADYAASLAGLEIPDLATNRRMLGPGAGNLAAQLARQSATLVQRGLLKSPAAPGPLLVDSFLPAVAP